MQEIIIIGIGQCGINLAVEFLKQLNYDHFLDCDNKIIDLQRYNQKLNVCYDENIHHQFIPRCLFIDLDSRSIEKVLIQKDFCFDPDNCLSKQASSLNNFGIGKLTEGAELFDSCINQLQKIYERSDSIGGMIVFHSTGGGTGSGLTAKLAEYIKEIDSTKIIHCQSIFPSGQELEALQIYNTILVLNEMTQNVDYNSVFDNKAMEYQCLVNSIPSSIHNYNRIIAESVIQTTASYRFPGQINGGMKKVQLNNVALPILHYFQPSYMPIINGQDCNVAQILSKKYKLCSFDDYPTEFITYSLQFRGQNFEIPESRNLLINRAKLYKFEELEFYSRVHTSISHRDHEQIIGFLGNSCAFSNYLKQFQIQVKQLYSKKAYLHVYQKVGLEEMEFSEALNSLDDLIIEYSPFENYENFEYEDEDQNLLIDFQ